MGGKKKSRSHLHAGGRVVRQHHELVVRRVTWRWQEGPFGEIRCGPWGGAEAVRCDSAFSCSHKPGRCHVIRSWATVPGAGWIQIAYVSPVTAFGERKQVTFEDQCDVRAQRRKERKSTSDLRKDMVQRPNDDDDNGEERLLSCSVATVARPTLSLRADAALARATTTPSLFRRRLPAFHATPPHRNDRAREYLNIDVYIYINEDLAAFKNLASLAEQKMTILSASGRVMTRISRAIVMAQLASLKSSSRANSCGVISTAVASGALAVQRKWDEGRSELRVEMGRREVCWW